MEHRQICWAHLLRKFVAFSERTGRGGIIGRELLDYTGVMFAYWDDVKTGKLCREDFRARMAPLRKQLEAALERAVAADIRGVSGSCADILVHKAALFTFVDNDDVEPTNGTPPLIRHRERLMTVAHTAKKQNVDVLAFLTACCTAARDGKKAPSLFAA